MSERDAESALLIDKQSTPQGGSFFTIGRAIVALAAISATFAAVTLSSQNEAASASHLTKAASASLSSDSSSKLAITISNAYGSLSDHTRDAYGIFDFVVEPRRETTFDVSNARSSASKFSWTLSLAASEKGEALVLETSTKQTFKYKFGVETNQWYTLNLVEETEGFEPRHFDTNKIVSKYVRREIRDLSDEDRNRVLDAMEVMYRTDIEEGRGLYGKDFKSSGELAALHSATSKYCFHWGDQFITSHPSFQLQFEKSIRAIDPDLSTTFYWDYMLDDALYSDTWMDQSPLYQDAWFGPVDTAEADHFVVKAGRFADLKVPTHRPETPFDMADYNAYGSVGQVCDQSPSDLVQRSATFCGVKTAKRLASAEDMVGCFMNHTKLLDWDICLEDNVHGNLHSLHGGAWDCHDDLQALADSDPAKYPQELMDYIGVSSFNMWFKEMNGAVGAYSCMEKGDEGWPCDRADATCAEFSDVTDYSDKVAFPDDQLYGSGLNTVLGFMAETQWGQKFLTTVRSDIKDKELMALGAEYKWLHLPASEQVDFGRWLMVFGANPGKTGIASTGAAPADPLFWAWHSIFDRMFHVLQLAPHFKDNYDFTWEDIQTDNMGCGGAWKDHFPFENIFDAAPKDVHFTNKQLWSYLDPKKDSLPYIYADFTKWGDLEWDPFALRAHT